MDYIEIEDSTQQIIISTINNSTIQHNDQKTHIHPAAYGLLRAVGGLRPRIHY